MMMILLLYELCVIFFRLTPYHVIELQISSSIPQIASSFCWLFICARAFNFDVAMIIIFAFIACALGVICKKKKKKFIAKTNVKEIFPYFF